MLRLTRLFVTAFGLLWILSACDSSSSSLSESASNSPPEPSQIRNSTNANSWLDQFNVYSYLKSSSGECLNRKGSCDNLSEFSVTQFKTVNGFNGMPYAVGEAFSIDVNADGSLDDVAKYSGNLATYSAKHSPSAVRKGLFTYFTYSGEVPLDGFETDNSKIGTTGDKGCYFTGSGLFKDAQGAAPALGIFVSRYNHVTGRVAKPVLVHMKCLNDAHDNAVINVDANNYVYLLVSGRAEARGNFIYRSASADSIDGFIDLTPAMDNYVDHFNDLAQAAGKGRPFLGDAYRGINYPKIYWVDESTDQGPGYFRLIYTIYCFMSEDTTCQRSRQLYTAKMNVEGDKISIQDIKPLAAYKGHYAVAYSQGRDLAVAFNFHPNIDLNDRTNIYYMHSIDGGETWLDAQNQELSLPIVSPKGLDQVVVREYYDPQYQGLITQRIYLKDINFVGTGLNKIPTILYVGNVSDHHVPSKDADHYLAKARWTGVSWVQRRLTNAVDHNYSSGMLFPADDDYRVFYPHTDDSKNNALAGGAVAYLDTGATDDVTGAPTLVTEDVIDPRNGSGTYLTDLCEFNYIKSVLNGDHDFVGILSGGNMYQYRKSAPLFIVDLYGGVRRLPTSFSDDEVIDGEVTPKPVVTCLDGDL